MANKDFKFQKKKDEQMEGFKIEVTLKENR